MLKLFLSVPFLIQGLYTTILYLSLIIYGIYYLLQAVLKFVKDKVTFKVIPLLTNTFTPLLAADALGTFALDYFSKSQMSPLVSGILDIMCIFNNISYVIRIGLVLICLTILIWKIAQQFIHKNIIAKKLTIQIVLFIFCILSLMLYAIDVKGGYIFGSWNKVGVERT